MGSVQHMLDDPELAPVGSGITTASTEPPALAEALSKSDPSASGSWVGGSADYFRGQRAMVRGDLITVRISLNDKATFNNSSSRTRKAKADTGTDFDVGLFGLTGQGAATANAGSNSTASGQGTITRSERVEVTLTAIVTKVYPNGMLYIEGSQQAMVNFERRDVKIAGIVHPKDISPDNSIDFAKIAEARVVYGGAGKVSDVQKPGWGLQLWDKINPF
jgi:flagellar L-ring protein FlgH